MEKSKVRVVGTFIEHDGKFLILRRRPDDGDCWGLPAGGVNKGETDAQAAVRRYSKRPDTKRRNQTLNI